MAVTTSTGRTSARTAPRAAGRRRRSYDQASYALYLIPSGLLFLAVIVVPFAMNIGISLTEWPGIGRLEWVGLDNYVRLLSDETFWSSFRNNLALIVAMAIIPTAVGLVLAAALFDFVGKTFGRRPASILRACFYLPQVLPIAVAGVVWGWILHPNYGALNTFLDNVGLGFLTQNWLGDPRFAMPSVMGIMIWVQIGFPVVIFMAGLQRIDPALHEAAEIDGASWWRRFWHITVPQIRPETYVVLLWTTVASLKVFAPIYVLTGGGPGGTTNVPAYFAYQNFFQRAQAGYGAAIATVLTLVIVALTIIFLRVQNREGRETP